MSSIVRLIARPLRRLVRSFAPRTQTPPYRLLGLPGFDPEYYLGSNADVRSARRDPLRHYCEHGWREGRRPSAGFDGQAYLRANPDVRAAGLNPLLHFLDHGLAEGRRLDAAPSGEAGDAGRAGNRDQGPVEQLVLDLIVARLERDGCRLALPAGLAAPLPGEGSTDRLDSLIRTLAALDRPTGTAAPTTAPSR